MDDRRMTERVHKAVEQRCEALAPDPFLAARVMRMAEEKGEIRVKKKLSVGLALCILMALLSLTALAAALLIAGHCIFVLDVVCSGILCKLCDD